MTPQEMPCAEICMSTNTTGEGDNPAGKPRRRGREGGAHRIARKVDYHNLTNPFPPMKVFSDDRIEAMHELALKVLEDLGMKVLLPQARELYRKGGAIIDEDSQMVFIGREMVAAALKSAPKVDFGFGLQSRATRHP